MIEMATWDDDDDEAQDLYELCAGCGRVEVPKHTVCVTCEAQADLMDPRGDYDPEDDDEGGESVSVAA